MDHVSTLAARKALSFVLPFLLALAPAARAAVPPAVRSAVEAHDAAVSSARETANSDAVALLKDEIAKAEAELAEARVAGNTSRQARALALRQVCEKALDSVEATGEAAFPETIRREIRPVVASIQDRLARVVDRRDAAVGAAGNVLRKAVREALQAEALPATEPDVDAAIAAAIATRKAAAPASAGPSDANTDDAVPGSETAPGRDAPKLLGESGPATAWAPLLGVAVKVNDIDVVSVPMTGIRERRTLTFEGGMGPVSAAITPTENILPQAPAGHVAFRALSVRGFPSPDIVEWPSARNGWHAQLRCRPGDDANVPVAAMFEVAANTPGLRSLGGSGVASAKADRIPVHLETRPAGATVLLDGDVVHGPDGRPLTTPCDVPMAPGGASLEFRLAGFVPKAFPNVVPKPGQGVSVALVRDPDYVDRVVDIRANVANGLSGVILKQGRRYRLRPEGSWSCDPAKTPTDCRGYDLERHPEFYSDPARYTRITADANYGALIFAIGKDGQWRGLPGEATLAPSATGPLRFDINEAGGARARMDNAGAVRIRIRSL